MGRALHQYFPGTIFLPPATCCARFPEPSPPRIPNAPASPDTDAPEGRRRDRLHFGAGRGRSLRIEICGLDPAAIPPSAARVRIVLVGLRTAETSLQLAQFFDQPPEIEHVVQILPGNAAVCRALPLRPSGTG